jgi:hypothetical protein
MLNLGLVIIWLVRLVLLAWRRAALARWDNIRVLPWRCAMWMLWMFLFPHRAQFLR